MVHKLQTTPGLMLRRDIDIQKSIRVLGPIGRQNEDSGQLPRVILGAGSEPADAARSSASRSTCCVRASRADTFLPPSSPAPAAEHRRRTSPVRPTARFRPRLGAGHGGAWNRREETWRKPNRRRLPPRMAVAISQRVEEGGAAEPESSPARRTGEGEAKGGSNSNRSLGLFCRVLSFCFADWADLRSSPSGGLLLIGPNLIYHLSRPFSFPKNTNQ